MYQLAWIVEQACATPRECRVAIARQQAHLSLDGTSFPPFINCDLGATDSAVYGGGPHTRLRASAARWARALPRQLSTVALTQLTDAPFNEEVIVHQVSQAPRRFPVPQHLGFGRMCTFLNHQLQRGSGMFRLPQKCPIVHGLPLHVAVDEGFAGTHTLLAILDLRRVSDRTDLDFALVPLPAILHLQWIRDCAGSLGVDPWRVSSAYFDDNLVIGDIEPSWPVHVITCIAPAFRLPGGGPVRSPALLDTSDHLDARLGIWQSRHQHADARLPSPVSGATPLHYLGPDPCVEYDFHTVFDPANLPASDAFEVIVHMLHEPSMRLWVPRFASVDAVRQLVLRLTGVPNVRLIFPRFAPCFHGGPCHVAALPSYASTIGLAIVDARRVFPSHFQGTWLVRLPDHISRQTLFAELLGDRRVSLTPCGVLCDGVHVGRDVVARRHVQVLTILAEAYHGLPCLEDNAQTARTHPGFLQHMWGGSPATATTTAARPSSVFPTTRTTTQASCPASHPAAPLLSADVIFYVSSFRGDIFEHTLQGQGHAAEILFELCQALRFHDCLQDDEEVHCYPRAFFTSMGARFFLHTRRPGAEELCWIVAPWMRAPLVCQCRHRLRRVDVLRAVGANDMPDVCIFLQGARQQDTFHAFHGDVIIVATRTSPLHSVPLHHLLHRVPDVQTLLLRHSLPTGRTVRDPDLHRAYWRSIAHSCQVAFGLHRPGAHSTLARVTFPCIVICTGDQELPTTPQVQAHWNRFLQPIFGICHLQCTATQERGHALYVQRMSGSQQQPWIVRLPFGVDTFLAEHFGSDTGVVELGPGWALRATSRHLYFGLAEVVPHGALPARPSTAESPLPPAHSSYPPAVTGSSMEHVMDDQAHPAFPTLADEFSSSSSSNLLQTAAVRRLRGDLVGGRAKELLDTASLKQRLLHVATPSRSFAAAVPAPVALSSCEGSRGTHNVSFWAPGCLPVSASIGTHDTAAKVCDTIAPLIGFRPDVGSLAPVFPQPGGTFQCVCSPCPVTADDICILVTDEASDFTSALSVSAQVTPAQILATLRLGSRLFSLAGSAWEASSFGLAHGCHLLLRTARFATLPHDVTEETIPPDRLPPQHGLRGGGDGVSQIVAITLDTLIPPPKPVAGFGVSREMLQESLKAYTFAALSNQLSTVRVRHESAFSVWADLPVWDTTQPIDELFLFVDGSFEPSTGAAAWALVALARCGPDVCKLGFIGNFARVYPASAYTAELEAILHAEALALSTRCALVHIASDCQAALLTSSGQSPTVASDHIARAAMSLHFAHQCEGRRPFRHKVAGHDGCAFNELADCIAKSYTRHGARPGLFDPGHAFWAAVEEGLFEWTWLLHVTSSFSLPPLTPSSGWSEANCRFPPSTAPATIGTRPPPDAVPSCCRLRLRCVQYNCLSLKGIAARELLLRGLEQSHVHVAFLQECRVSQDPIIDLGTFWVLSSQPTPRGGEGCQIWLRKSYSLTDDHSAVWQRNSFTILVSEPRLLVVLAEAGGLRFCLVSAHAFTSAQAPQICEEWWEHLAHSIHRAPGRCVPLCGIDANARFEQDPRQPDTHHCMPCGVNAECLLAFASAHRLFISPQYASDGHALTSWISPTGRKALLDYVLAPYEWQPVSLTSALPGLGDLHEGIDHFPITCRFTPRLQVTAACNPRPVNWRALDSDFGRSVANFAIRTAPDVAWDVDVTTHVDVLHRHFNEVAAKLLPEHAKRPRSPVFTTDTLQLVLNRRGIRRTVKNTARTANRTILAVVVQAWKAVKEAPSSPVSPLVYRLCRDAQAASRNAVRWQIVLFNHNKATWAAMAKDKADFFRSVNNQARDAGPAQFAHRLRAILRTGRRFKTPLVLPLLQSHDGPAVGRDAVLDGLGTFFAEAERAEKVAISDMLAQHSVAEPDDICLESDALPSIAAVAAGFASLQRHRAAGLSQIPADFYRANPLGCAAAFFPVLMKVLFRGISPFQWTGGLLHSIPKPGKNATSPEGWRSILLLENDGKAILKTMRPGIVRTMQRSRALAQFGGLPAMPLTVPAAFVRAHLVNLHTQRRTGGIVFFDVRAAYYSVVRDFLTSTSAQRADDHFVQHRAQRLFADASLQQHFVEAFRRGNLLTELGADPATVAFFQSHLRCTWFVTRHDTDYAFKAESGTAPGSPVADVLFGLLFSGFLKDLQDSLCSLGVNATAHWVERDPPEDNAECPGQPTWADDLAVLFQSAQAADVEGTVAAIAQVAELGLRRLGLEPNYLPNKTEALVAIHGKGSKAVRRTLLSPQSPSVAFTRHDGTTERIRLVSEYVHLGTVVRGDLSEISNIRKRERLMRAIFKPVRAKLLSNSFLTSTEKAHLLRERVFTRYTYGSGLWRLSTNHEQHAAAEPLAKILRSSVKPITGLSSRGITTFQCAAMLHLPLPAELLCVERVRAACELAQAAPNFVWDALIQDRVWIQSAMHSITEVMLAADPSWSHTLNAADLPAFVTRHAESLRRAGRRFLQHCISSREPSPTGAPVVPHRPAEVIDVEVEPPPPLPFVCHCGASFVDARRLAVHHSRMHGDAAPLTAACFGTRCERCCTEYWSWTRLRGHLRKSPACFRSYAASDLDGGRPVQKGHSADPDGSWCPPCRAEGPVPWWATLDPDTD